MSENSSQSPRALRASTENAEKYSQGEVQLGMTAPKKSGGAENEGAWQHIGKGHDQKYEPKPHRE
jgi:hypothetical protein